jgi:hypothetical protein
MQDYNENYSHRLRATGDLEIHYSARREQAEIHKAGCRHAATQVKPFNREIGADDYYWVAPCARAR